jgi:hypothetical protein
MNDREQNGLGNATGGSRTSRVNLIAMVLQQHTPTIFRLPSPGYHSPACDAQ